MWGKNIFLSSLPFHGYKSKPEFSKLIISNYFYSFFVLPVVYEPLPAASDLREDSC